VAAIEQSATFSGVVASKGEALRRDAVRRVQYGGEHDLILQVRLLEEAEQWRLPVVGAEAAEKPGVCDEAPPAAADGGGAG
jgi:hypothetical protein